jgi:hypothetical protein
MGRIFEKGQPRRMQRQTMKTTTRNRISRMKTIPYNAFRIIHIMFLKMEIKSYFSDLLHAEALRVG